MVFIYSKYIYFLLCYLTTKRVVQVDVTPRRRICVFRTGEPSRTLYSLILYIHNTGMFLLNAPRAVSSKYRKRRLLAGGKKKRDVARRSISRERASRSATYTEIWKILWNISYLVSWLKSYGLVLSSRSVFTLVQASHLRIFTAFVYLHLRADGTSVIFTKWMAQLIFARPKLENRSCRRNRLAAMKVLQTKTFDRKKTKVFAVVRNIYSVLWSLGEKPLSDLISRSYRRENCHLIR